MRKNKKPWIMISAAAFTGLFGMYYYLTEKTGIVRLPKNILAIDHGGLYSSYLVKIPDGYLLFDTGYDRDFSIFLAFLNQNEIKPSEIKYLFISHGHDDHAGYIGKIVEIQPDLKLIVHQKTADRLATGMNNKDNDGGLVNPLIYAAFRIKQTLDPSWTLSFPPYQVRDNDIILKEDAVDLSDLLGINATVISTPGHTSDSYSLIIDDETILVGDAASYFANWAGTKHLTIFNENLDQVYSSWKKILSMGIKYIIPSHGKPFAAYKLRDNLHQYKQADLVPFF
ncbi:MAG: MBL fold metallo-hydrolase [Anaerolineae bacterium]|nr:MBL fold metallo-hydrolase [Anaerolineae bacterium]